MDLDSAALSSIATALDDITTRIGDIAGRYEGTPRADVASDLYDVERALRTAVRQLAKVRSAL